MLHPSTKKLIDRLTEMTERGKLNWAEGENDAVTYVTEGYSVSLTVEPNELVIISSEGKELERATVEQLAGTTTGTGAAYTSIVAALTQEASRIARGTESAISSLLAGIDIDGDTPPETPVFETAPPFDDAGAAEAQVEDIADETTAAAGEGTASPSQEEREEEQAPASAEAETPDNLTGQDMVGETDADTNTGETEPDMTEAVARLAKEVNGRDDEAKDNLTNTLAATAAGGLAVATAVQASDDDESSDGENTETVTDTVAAEYVPFGLETADEASEEEIAEVAMQTDETPDPVSEAEDEPAEVAPAAIAPIAEMASDSGKETLETAPDAIDTMAVANDADEPIETVETVETVMETAQETLTETHEEPAQSEADPEPRTYSLSGIGAGFGLGALTATTEATGVPSASGGTVPEEKIIIDATDDMPLTPPESSGDTGSGDTGPAGDLPDIAALEQPEETAPVDPVSETAEAEMAEDGEIVLEPRTRFNPWN